MSGQNTGLYTAHYRKHSRTSCSDSDPCNADVDGSGCHRCNAIIFDREVSARKELAAARALLRKVADSLQECDSGGIFDPEKRMIRSYLDARDTLAEREKP